VTTYSYVAIDQQGQAVSGTVDAADWDAAREVLAARGLGDCRPAPASAPIGPAPRLGTEEAVELASYLSALARAGLPMAAGVRALAGDLPAGQLPAALNTLAARLESGHSLESALDALGPGLPAHVRHLMVAGARSGRLAETLDELLAHERTMDDMGRWLWQSVAYPAMLLAFLVVWLLFIALWLIPQMEMSAVLDDIESMQSWNNTPRPRPPNHSRRLSEFSRVAPPLILSVLGGVVLAVGAARAIGGKAAVSRLVARVPLLGPAWWYRSLVEFSGLLAAFLKQKLPLGEALHLVSLSARDAAVRAAAAKAEVETATGRELARCLADQPLVPPTLVNLVEWGQRHAALADSLDSARQMYRDRFDQQLRLIRVVVPPIIFLLVAGSALFVAYGWLSSITAALKLLAAL
jgi:type II secretory pathway component PulF